MENLNENNNEVINEKTNTHYLLGTLGAFLGGFIAAIPWVLVYVFGNMLFSALAILIAIGALKGYQLFKGTIDKKLPVILSIVSLLVVIITTLVIIPFALIIHEGLGFDIEYFKFLYTTSDFTSAIIQDLIVSIAFTALGISGVVSNVNRQIKMSKKPLEKISVANSIENPNAVNTEMFTGIKNIFQNHNAMDKEHTVDKNSILPEIEEIENGKNLFNTLKMQNVIRKSKGRYYYSEENEKNTQTFTTANSRFFIIFIIIIIATSCIAAINSNDDTTNSLPSDKNSISTFGSDAYISDQFGLKISIPEDMIYVSGNSLDYIIGDGASEIYEFTAYTYADETTYRLLNGLISELSENETTAQTLESFKQAYLSDNASLLSDYATKNISGIEFTAIEFQSVIDGISYNDLCFFTFKDNKFFFLEYIYPAIDSKEVLDSLDKMISKHN